MKKSLKFLVFLLISLNCLLLIWYVLHQDINFSSDIARDFFILNEISIKKIVLIGPNSSTGLFHGPLWAYLNFPAYLFGKGDPIMVGWFWVLLSISFVIITFFISSKIFNKTVGFLTTIMLSLYMFFHVHNLYNPHGAMLLIPVFFYLFIRYLQTQSFKYLISHLFITGAIIQFQMAIGIPFFILSSLALTTIIVKQKKWIHFSSFAVIPITLINFIIFDFRHNHLLYSLLTHYLNSAKRDHPNYFLLGFERIKLMLSSAEILRRDSGYLNLILFFILLGFIYLQIKNKKYTTVYYSFLYFYFGFFLLSMLNTGPLLYFYLFPLFPLVFLIFSSFITSKYSKIFLVLFSIIFIQNFNTVISDIKDSNNIIGKSIYSWNFLHSAARKIFEGSENELGYFVYAPNTLAYEGKYALLYTQTEFPQKKVYVNIKKSITYLFIAPPPPNNPYMEDAWWRINKVKLDAKPVNTISFSNGYKIEQYKLTADQIAIPPDPTIDPGLFFR